METVKQKWEQKRGMEKIVKYYSSFVLVDKFISNTR